MERVEFLMLRLLEQYRRNESPAELIAALGRIEQELLLSFTAQKKLDAPTSEFENLPIEETIIPTSNEILEEEAMPLFEIFQDGKMKKEYLQIKQHIFIIMSLMVKHMKL